MINKDFDLDKVGKRMPYTTPDRFFTNLEDDIWKEVKKDFQEKKDKSTETSTELRVKRMSTKWHILMRSAIGMAAAVALVFVLNMNFSKSNNVSMNDVDKAFSQLTTDDQVYLLNIYQEDVFINE